MPRTRPLLLAAVVWPLTCQNAIIADVPAATDDDGPSSRCCPAGGTCCAVPGGEQCVPEGEACPVVCRDERLCPAGARCLDDGLAVTGCVEACPAERTCGATTCCAPGLGCAAGACEAPDLLFDPLEPPSLAVEHRTLDELACEVREECAGGPGERHLARLSMRIANQGAVPFWLGAREADGVFAGGTCDTARALPGFVGWRLLGADEALLASGALDVYCLAAGEGFDCAAQGIAAGTSAAAVLGATCDFVDVSTAPYGAMLELTLDPAGLFPESDTSNNTARLPVSHCDGVVCGGVCCPQASCASGVCRLPDLQIDEPALVDSITVGESRFATNDCALTEGCIDEDGTRRLLRFAVVTPNLGNADLFFGDPSGSPNMIFAACHGHYHFDGYAAYRLRDQEGRVLAQGHKQAFCLQDSQPAAAGAGAAQFNCDYQGISVGWADNYYNGLDCQWIDVTGLAEGNYVLEVEVNPRLIIDELDYSNNVARAPFFLPADPNACLPSPDLCGDGQDQDCDGTPDDGCPPVSGNDSCAGAHLIEGGGVLRATLAGATADHALPCGGSGPDLAFTFEVLREEVVYLSTYGSSVDTVLALYRDSCSGTPVACSDDGCGETQSDIAEVLAPGRYYVVLKAFEAGASGEVRLKMLRSGCTGEHLGGVGTYSGSTAAGQDTMSLSCAPSNGPEDIRWFTTCPGGATAVRLDTCGTTFDTVLELRRDSCRGAVPFGACKDESGGECGEGSHASMISAELEGSGAGDGLWFVIVDGYRAGDKGAYQLRLSAP